MTAPQQNIPVLVIGGAHLKPLAAGLKRAASQASAIDLRTLEAGNPANFVFADDDLRIKAEGLAGKLPPEGLMVFLAGSALFEDENYLRHAGSFDLLMISVDGGTVQAGQPVIPAAMMRRHFDAQFRKGYGRQLADLAKRSRAPVVLIGPPAPRADSGAGATALLRLKLWTLQQQVMAGFCREQGIVFLGNPREARDEAGFLKRAYHGNGPAGNSDYGYLVALQIGRVLAQRGVPSPLQAAGRGAA